MSEPMTPADLDLRDFPYMPLDVVRLRDSEGAVMCSGDEFRAAVLLWCAAWHQVPAASLPDDERLLAHLAGYGRDVQAWLEVSKGALRGFIKCDDGRLYHPVIAEKAIEAATKRKAQRQRTQAATEARRNATPERDKQRNEECNDERNEVQGKGREGKVEEGKKESSMGGRCATRPAREQDFEEAWKIYPKREGANPKAPARKKYHALVKSGVDPDVILSGIRAYADELRRTNKIGTVYVAQAQTWFNQQRWGDYSATAPPDRTELIEDMRRRGYEWSDKDQKWAKVEERQTA